MAKKTRAEKELDLADELDKALDEIEEDMAPYLGHEDSAEKAIEKARDIVYQLRIL